MKIINKILLHFWIPPNKIITIWIAIKIYFSNNIPLSIMGIIAPKIIPTIIQITNLHLRIIFPLSLWASNLKLKMKVAPERIRATKNKALDFPKRKQPLLKIKTKMQIIAAPRIMVVTAIPSWREVWVHKKPQPWFQILQKIASAASITIRAWAMKMILQIKRTMVFNPTIKMEMPSKAIKRK